MYQNWVKNINHNEKHFAAASVSLLLRPLQSSPDSRVLGIIQIYAPESESEWVTARLRLGCVKARNQLISFGGAQYHCRPQIWEFSSVRHASLALLVNIAEYHSLGRWIEYRVQYHPSMRVLTWKSATACSKTWTLDLVGARATSYQLSHSNLIHYVTCRSGSYMKVCPRSVS